MEHRGIVAVMFVAGVVVGLLCMRLASTGVVAPPSVGEGTGTSAVLARLDALERSIAELVSRAPEARRAAPMPVEPRNRTTVVGEGEDREELAAIVERLDGIVESVAVLSSQVTLQSSERARIWSSLSGPGSTKTEALRSLWADLRNDSPSEATRSEWYFATAEHVLRAFGRPTVWDGSYWIYEFLDESGAEVRVLFLIQDGLVKRLEG
jgi:hypothetical protein